MCKIGEELNVNVDLWLRSQSANDLRSRRGSGVRHQT